MEGRFTALQHDRYRHELRALRRCEHSLDCVHLSSQAGDRQQIPAVAAWHVLQASVLHRHIVERDPAREVRDRHGAGPVGVILMPGDDTAAFGRLAEQLIVPEADGSTK